MGTARCKNQAKIVAVQGRRPKAERKGLSVFLEAFPFLSLLFVPLPFAFPFFLTRPFACCMWSSSRT